MAKTNQMAYYSFRGKIDFQNLPVLDGLETPLEQNIFSFTYFQLNWGMPIYCSGWQKIDNSVISPPKIRDGRVGYNICQIVVKESKHDSFNIKF